MKFIMQELHHNYFRGQKMIRAHFHIIKQIIDLSFGDVLRSVSSRQETPNPVRA